MKIVIKHKVLAAVAKNLQTINDITASFAGQYALDVVAEAAKDLAEKKSYVSKAVKINNDPKGETLTVVLNDDVLVELLEAQGDLLKGMVLPIKLYAGALARIKKDSF